MPIEIQADSKPRLQLWLDGDDSIDALHNGEQTIWIVGREHLLDFVSENALSKWDEDPWFPANYGELAREAGDKNGAIARADGAGIDLPAHRLKTAIEMVTNGTSWDADEFTMWTPATPAADIGPFILETDRTPNDWFIEIAFDRDEFRERFGARSCPDCPTVFKDDDGVLDHRITCPTCNDYPEAVKRNLSKLRDAHQGVLAVMAPRTE
jgi:hypothetical protein